MGKVVFSPYYFLINFKDLLGVKLNLNLVLEKLNTLRDREKKKEKIRNPSRTLRFCEWNSSA